MLTAYFIISGLLYILYVWFLFHTKEGSAFYRRVAFGVYRSALKRTRTRDQQYNHENLRSACKVCMWCFVILLALIWPYSLFNVVFTLKG